MNNKKLYESIMASVAIEVKRALDLNESISVDDSNIVVDNETGRQIGELWNDWDVIEFFDDITDEEMKMYKSIILADKDFCKKYYILDDLSFITSDDVIHCDRCGEKMIDGTEEHHTRYGTLCDCCYGDMFESKKHNHKYALTESLHDDYVAVYTGLLYNDRLADIIDSFVGQIWDGIGEGDSRESKIFNYYYKELDGISSGCVNDELVVKSEYPIDVKNLIRGIWRVAQIERSDRGTNDKNINYEYLSHGNGVSWREICTLQAALNNDKTTPWTEEERQKALARRDASIAKAEAAAKAEEERLAAEAAAKEAADTEHINNVISHSVEDKDVKRATDAWNRTHSLSKFFDVLLQQLNKIEDNAKAHRRTVAFYNEALNHVNEPDYDRVMERFKSLMLNRF